MRRTFIAVAIAVTGLAAGCSNGPSRADEATETENRSAEEGGTDLRAQARANFDSLGYTEEMGDCVLDAGLEASGLALEDLVTDQVDADFWASAGAQCANQIPLDQAFRTSEDARAFFAQLDLDAPWVQRDLVTGLMSSGGLSRDQAECAVAKIAASGFTFDELIVDPSPDASAVVQTSVSECVSG